MLQLPVFIGNPHIIFWDFILMRRAVFLSVGLKIPLECIRISNLVYILLLI